MSDDSDFGLLPEGFVPMSFADVRLDLATAVQLAFGASINVGDTSIFGQLIAIVAERIATLWEQLAQVVASQDPDKAAGAMLDALAALTGTFRPDAASSTVVLTLTGTPSSTIPSGSQAATASTGIVFATDAAVTLATVPAWVNSTSYAVGDRVVKNTRVYQCTTAGTSAVVLTGGPTGTGTGIVDGTVTWEYVGDGTGAGDVEATATTTGALVGAARDVTVIKTPQSGWTSVINLLDADPGRAIASDGELRELRELELAGEGTGTVDAIRAAVLKLTDSTAAQFVKSCTVFENTTDVTDSNSTPPHSVQVLVDGPDDTEHNTIVAACLLAQVSAGIGTYGLTTVNVPDSEGTEHAISFSHPTEVDIYVDITLKYDAATYPADGDTEVATAIGNITRTIGLDAVAARIGAVAFSVPGVLDVPRSGSLGGCLISTSPGPTSDATITIAPLQVAGYNAVRVTVHSSPATP